MQLLKPCFPPQCVDPATGDVVYDDFHDSKTFGELETRISHLKPVEVLLSAEVSDGLHRILTDISALRSESLSEQILIL